MVGSRNSRSGRLPGGLLAGVAAASLLAGCGNGVSGATAAGSPTSGAASAAASSASGPTQSPLSKGLLSPSAFGSQATVTTVTLQQFRQATAGRLGAAGLTIDPPQCADALMRTQPDASTVKDLVAESAMTRDGGRGTVTVEALATGELVDTAIDTLTSAVAHCPKVTVTAQQGTATVEFAPIDVSTIADQAAAARVTATITPPGHGAVTVPAVMGAVRDGNRLVLLFTAVRSEGGATQPAPDTAAFTSLLQKAYTTEKNALG